MGGALISPLVNSRVQPICTYPRSSNVRVLELKLVASIGARVGTAAIWQGNELLQYQNVGWFRRKYYVIRTVKW